MIPVKLQFNLPFLQLPPQKECRRGWSEEGGKGRRRERRKEGGWGERRRKRRRNIQFVLPIYSLEHDHTSNSQLLLLHLKPSIGHFSVLITNVRIFLDSFLSELLLFGGGYCGMMVGVVTEALYDSPSQLWVCSHPWHWKRSFCALYSKQQHRSWMSTWFLATAWATCIIMVSGGNTGHGHSPWPSVVTWAMSITMALGTGHVHQHGL